ALARGRRSDVNHIYQTSTAWLMISTWPIYLMFAIVGGPLLEVFGKGYSTGGRPLLALLAVAMLIATGCGMVDSVLNMAGRTWWNLMNVAIAFGVNLGVDLWLIPRLGILGAAIGWAAAIVTQNAFSLLMVGIKVKVHPFGRATLSVAAGSLVCFGLVPWVTLLVLGEGIRTVVVSGAIGVVLYAGFLWTFRRLLQLQALISVKRPKKGGRRGGVADGSSAQPEGRSQLQPQTPDDDS
ncbi:MAG: polysaccharide biosynthesis C-terminal domain-containing protein, partial [Lapillicoccus sp.]